MRIFRRAQPSLPWLAMTSGIILLGMTIRLHADPRTSDGSAGVSRGRPVPATSDDEDQDIRAITKQLDEILEVQAVILQRYDELMEELQVIKVRASR